MSPILGIIASSKLVASGSYESIATASPSGTNTVTLSSIASTYKHLQLRILSKSTLSGTSQNTIQMRLRFNGDSGSNYTYHRLTGDGSTAAAAQSNPVSAVILDALAVTSESPISSSNFGVGIIDLIDYASTTKNKTVRAFNGSDRNGAGSSEPAIAFDSSVWMSTSAITSIEVLMNSGNFASGTTISLYGIKG